MDQKTDILLAVGVMVLVVFASGCTDLAEKKSPEPNLQAKNLVFSGADLALLSSLKERLSHQVTSYEASYKRNQEYHLWGGHSGSTNFKSNSEIAIKVEEGRVVNYTKTYIRETGARFEKEEYFEYYDLLKNQSCKEESIVRDIISSDYCLPAAVSRPLMFPLRGCKSGTDEGNFQFCICNESKIPIYDDKTKTAGFPCREDIWDDDLIFGYYNVKYYPETGNGVCFYEVSKGDEHWLVECLNQGVVLNVKETRLKTLTKAVCSQTGYLESFGHCWCSFDETEVLDKALICNNGTPDNFDLQLKAEVVNYVEALEAKVDSIAYSIPFSENNLSLGYCYNFSYASLEHIFCFNGDNLLTFAQWGHNFQNQGSTNVDISRVEMKEFASVN